MKLNRYSDYSEKVKYELCLDGLDFLVEFIPKIGYWEMMYYSWDSKINNWSVSRLVSGNPFKIVQKVFGDILLDFINKNNPDKIIINGLSKEKESSYISKRTLMYLRFLIRNTPLGYSVFPNNLSDVFSNKISIVKK